MNETKLMAMFVEQIDKLQAERKTIDDKIAALELAYETVTGKPTNGHNGHHRKVSAPRIVVRKLKRDADGGAKVLAYLRERRAPTGVPAIRRETRATAAAIYARLRALVAEGSVKRIGRGLYQAVSS